ncbi:hypothetical protein [Candidatus Chlorohelix sp.]|uniref:hypothetical protein n=1 Tax=Candidatus Chlorohelix sp. TaxID=3139201 RepID=UPI00306E7567
MRPYFAERPLNLGDRYYPTKAFMQNNSKDYDLLLRLKSNWVFYQEVGRRIFEELIAVASGKQSKSEAQGVGEEEFCPWILGATM